ncbi:MAG: 30S ribosomal protein S19 [Candidatus Aenigmarchaeota archaeon]|nr:30S ribosomal protein S19 [Candidatus Aenigmarchaeota archaeon]
MYMAEFRLRGYTLEELEKMSLEDLAKKVFDSRTRRKILKRGFIEQEKKFLEKIKEIKQKNPNKFIKTHLRQMVILPIMVGLTIGVHNGKEFVPVKIKPEMIGRRLGEFSIPIKEVKHGGPGIGATRGTKFLSVK